MARAQQVPAMSNPGVIVLNQNTKREQGKKAQLGNIAANEQMYTPESIAVARGARYNPKIKLVAPLARYFMET